MRRILLLAALALLFGCKEESKADTTFTDERDGKVYKYVNIGEQTWMAENLNYEAEGSRCYGEGGEVCTNPGTDSGKYKCNEKITLSNDEIQANCKKYGRLYDWVTAMKLPENCEEISCLYDIPDKHQGICPDGWHLPSTDDWFILYKHVDISFRNGFAYHWDSSTVAGKYLKAKNGWNEYEGKSGNGTDDYGFAALPGGLGSFDGHLDGNFAHVGHAGLWWTANYSDKRFAKTRILRFDTYEAHNRSVSFKTSLLSVRCVRD